jgi:hypothetical protein
MADAIKDEAADDPDFASASTSAARVVAMKGVAASPLLWAARAIARGSAYFVVARRR